MDEGHWRRYISAILRRHGVLEDDAEDLCQNIVLAYWLARGATPWEDDAPQKSLIAHLIKAQLA